MLMKPIAPAIYPNSLIAQQDPTAAAFTGIAILGGVVAALIVLLLIVNQIRKRLVRGESANEPPFTLDSIRHMRDRGDLSEGEYEVLRQRIIDQASR